MQVLRSPALVFQGRNADNFANASLQMSPCLTLTWWFVDVGMGSSLFPPKTGSHLWWWALPHGNKQAEIAASTPTQNRNHSLALFLCPRLSLGRFTPVLRSEKEAKNCLFSVLIHADSGWFACDGLMHTLQTQVFSSVVWSLEIIILRNTPYYQKRLLVWILHSETFWDRTVNISPSSFAQSRQGVSHVVHIQTQVLRMCRDVLGLP